jgi:hypothetical protein
MLGVVHFTSKGVVLLNSPHKLVTNSYREKKQREKAIFLSLLHQIQGHSQTFPGIARGRGAPVLICACVLVLGFRVSSISIVVGHVMMGLLVIIYGLLAQVLIEGVVSTRACGVQVVVVNFSWHYVLAWQRGWAAFGVRKS